VAGLAWGHFAGGGKTRAIARSAANPEGDALVARRCEDKLPDAEIKARLERRAGDAAKQSEARLDQAARICARSLDRPQDRWPCWWDFCNESFRLRIRRNQ